MNQYKAIARRFGLGRNSLRRGSDRIESAVLWLALVASLLLLPVSAAFGTSVEETNARTAAELRATGTQVVARTLDAVAITPSTTVVVSHPVRAAWTDANGVQHEGTVRVPQGTRAGTELRVWLDQAGTPVDPPKDGGLAAFLGTLAGVSAFIGGLFGIWSLVWMVRFLLDRLRLRRWQADWQRFYSTSRTAR